MTFRDSIQRLVSEFGLNLCIQCGRCASSCPMEGLYSGYRKEMAPRRIVQRVLLGEDLLHDPSIWYCLACRVCTLRCPQGVRFRGFIRGMRQVCIENGVKEMGWFCPSCGGYVLPIPTLDLLQERLERSMDPLLVEACPRCRPRIFGERAKAFRRKGSILSVPVRVAP